MKVLIGIEDSEFSLQAARFVAQRTWPAGTEVRLVSAVEVHGAAGYGELDEHNVYRHARQAIDQAVAVLQESQNTFTLSTEIIEGSPKHVVLDEAERWGADLIVVGSHGRRGFQRFLLGSVSQAVALHAHCSVMIVRPPRAQQS